MTLNKAMIKYIHLKQGLNPNFNQHKIEDYELKRTIFTHTSYADMVEQVNGYCPSDFKCINPLALHHEILWYMNKEQDRVFCPIDQTDYARINWSKQPITPVCVEVVPLNAKGRGAPEVRASGYR